MKIAFVLLLCLAGGGVRAEALTWQHGLSYFGDFKYPADFPHFDYVNPDAPKGGRLTRRVAPFNSFTPFIAKGLPAPGVSVIGEISLYDSLMWPSGDEVGVFYGVLAKEIAVSEDSTQVRMRLREEAHWHDGVPVTARDIEFTFEHIKANAFPGVKAAFLSLASVEAVSEKEVLFRYHLPVNLNAMMALGKVAMLPEHYWRDRDSSATSTEPPLSSGPYRIGDFELGKFVEFERVPEYWGRNIGVNKGRHNIDVLRYEVFRDATVEREAFRKGLLDYFDEPSAVQWVSGYDMDGPVGEYLLQDYHDFKQYVGSTIALGYNMSKPPFQDVRVREALSLAFDFDWMNRVLDFGVYEKPDSYFHGSFLAARGLPTERELEFLAPFRDSLPDRLYTEPPFAESHMNNVPRRARLARAQTLLNEAGWRYVDGERVNGKGDVLEVDFVVTTLMGKRLLVPYTAELKALGINSTLRLVEPAQYTNLRRNNVPDAVMGALAISLPPNQELPAYFASSSFGTANFARLSSPVVDTLIERVMSAATREELTAASRALDRVLYWQFYYIPVRVLEPNRVVLWDKYGRPERDALYRTAFPDAWWWDAAKAERVHAVLGLEQ